MRIPKRGERGFTLIELLIVIAILGVLAAVVIPNVGRFMGAGQSEAAETELADVQLAVTAMMTDNKISALPNPVSTETKDMMAFPDSTTTVADKGADAAFLTAANATGVDGYLLWGHQIIVDVDGDGTYDAGDGDAVIGGDSTTGLVKYVAERYTKGTYTVISDGTVTQEDTGYD